jgi:hypothetical protein
MNEKVYYRIRNSVVLFRVRTAYWEISLQALNRRVIFVDYAKPDTKRSMGMPIARGPPEDLNKQQTVDSPQDKWDTLWRTWASDVLKIGLIKLL